MNDGQIDLIIKRLRKEIDCYSRPVSSYDEGYLNGLFDAIQIILKVKNGF